jgi:hypothetical protein
MAPLAFCGPVTGSKLAEALQLSKTYGDLLDGWRLWLCQGPRPSNAEKLFLWRLIDLTRTRRARGVWKDVDSDFLPTVEAMDAVLDKDEYYGFEAQVLARRQNIEVAARELVQLLDSPELMREVNAHPDTSRLQYIAQLTEGLGESHVGMLYLRSAVTCSPPDDPDLLPLVNPRQLTKTQETWRTVTDASGPAKEAAGAYLHLLFQVMPAVFNDKVAFDEVSLDFILRFVQEDRLVNAGSVQQAMALADDIILKDVDAWVKANQPWWSTPGAKKLGASIGGIFDLISLGMAVSKLRENPSAANVAALLRALSALTASASTFGEHFARARFLVRSGQLINMLSAFNAVYDVAMAAVAFYDSSEAANKGDYSVAVGQAMQGVGLSVAAGASVYATAAVGAAAIPGLQLLALAALVLVLGGALLSTYTADTPYETWLQNCWFGEDWDDVDLDEKPNTPMYRTKLQTESGLQYPDIARQVSTWLSILFPVELEVTKRGLYVHVRCKPVLAGPDSIITVTRIDSDGLLPAPYTETLVYQRRLGDDTDPDVEVTVTGTSPLECVTEWRARFHCGSWWPTFDLGTRWFEVTITPSSPLAARLMDEIKAGASLPFLIRARTEVKSA